MIRKAAAWLLTKVIKPSADNVGNVSDIARGLASHPIKLIAAFFIAPILLYRVTQKAENPVRRHIATAGIIISIIFAYFAGTLLGTTVAALLIAAKVGLIMGAAFFIGTWVSVFFSVLFQVLALNAVSYLFLKISSQEVVDYLDEVSS